MDADDTVVHVARVCCLECGTNYLTPTSADGGGTSHGCPACGYRGWIFAVVPLPETEGPRSTPGPRPRSGADQPRRRSAQPR
jgi:DNA-directed RNA polymerase subunit RPC12/RpoP